MREPDAFPCQRVNVWSFDLRVSVAAHLVETLVIGEHEDDIHFAGIVRPRGVRCQPRNHAKG